MTWLLELYKDQNDELIISIGEKIESIEVTALKQSIETLEDYRYEMELILPLKQEFKDYLEYINSKKVDNEVVRRVQNYLNTYRTFINHWETFSKRKSKEIADYFKTELSSLYDSSFEYRLIYNLRNFAAHSGVPVSNISKSIDGSVQIYLTRTTFLNDYKKMQKKLYDELIHSKQEYIDVHQAILKVHDELGDFHLKMLNYILKTSNNEYLKAAINIIKFNKNHIKHNGTIALSNESTVARLRNYFQNPSDTEIEYQEVPIDLATEIAKSSYVKVCFKGKYKGVTDGFPYMMASDLVFLMPEFYVGKKYVEVDNTEWIRVSEAKGQNWLDGYDRYFAIYMPSILNVDQYSKVTDQFKSERDKLFDNKTAYIHRASDQIIQTET